MTDIIYQSKMLSTMRRMLESLTTKAGLTMSVKLLVNLICLSYVLYQTQKCWGKYQGNLKSVDVSIERAFKEPYPEITLCPSLMTEEAIYHHAYHHRDYISIIEDHLKDCYLAYFSYFDDIFRPNKGALTQNPSKKSTFLYANLSFPQCPLIGLLGHIGLYGLIGLISL